MNLTTAEIKSLRTILRNGGLIRVSMGRLGSDGVQKTTLYRLEDAGLVRIVKGQIRTGPCRLDVEVTADGCRAINAAGV